MEPLTTAELERVGAAIGRAEQATAGEIRVVVASRPLVREPFHAVMWSALAALALPWPLALLTSLGLPVLLSLQAVTFIAVAGVLLLTPLGRYVVPRSVRASATRAAAIDQFLAHDIHQTRGRTGVLILVALHEHRVEVVADEGIHARVDADAWAGVCAAVLGAAGTGRLADGLVAGVAEAGRLLALHAPASGRNANELSDRVVMI